MSNLSRYKEDLQKLTNEGDELIKSLTKKNDKNIKFELGYQEWYTEACIVIEQLLPSRLKEFIDYYLIDTKRKKFDSTTYKIQDWLKGSRAGIGLYNKKIFDDYAIVVMNFNNQILILKSVNRRFESSLFDIKQVVQAELFDSEIDSAKELLSKGFLRGSGAIAGVVLEKHLHEVCKNHSISLRKKNPTISDFNELLKKNKVLSLPDWRNIQRLGDIRNLCDHNKKEEPTKEKLLELVEGVEKIIKTIF